LKEYQKAGEYIKVAAKKRESIKKRDKKSPKRLGSPVSNL